MIGQKVRQQIKKSDYTFSEVARKMNVDKSTMQRLFKSDSIQSRYLEQIAEIINVPIRAFFEENYQNPPREIPAATVAIFESPHHGNAQQLYFYGFASEKYDPKLMEKVKEFIQTMEV